jgi:hypothetical protein
VGTEPYRGSGPGAACKTETKTEAKQASEPKAKQDRWDRPLLLKVLPKDEIFVRKIDRNIEM